MTWTHPTSQNTGPRAPPNQQNAGSSGRLTSSVRPYLFVGFTLAAPTLTPACKSKALEPMSMARDDADDAKIEESLLTVLIVFLVFLSFMVAITVHAALKASKKKATTDAHLRASALAARGSTFLAVGIIK